MKGIVLLAGAVLVLGLAARAAAQGGDPSLPAVAQDDSMSGRNGSALAVAQGGDPSLPAVAQDDSMSGRNGSALAAAQGGDPSLPAVAQDDSMAGPNGSALAVARGDPSLPAVAQDDSLMRAQEPLSSYSLDWWTVDGGGAGYRSAGGFTLGGTAGQPDAAVARSGGVYTLRGGFWLPSCTAAAVETTIERSGNSVTLVWTHNDANQVYQVHRAATPYFTPADATWQAQVSAEPWSYPDPDPVIGDPAANYYYLVRSACGAAYADAGGTAAFNFALTPGTP